MGFRVSFTKITPDRCKSKTLLTIDKFMQITKPLETSIFVANRQQSAIISIQKSLRLVGFCCALALSTAANPV